MNIGLPGVTHPSPTPGSLTTHAPARFTSVCSTGTNLTCRPIMKIQFWKGGCIWSIVLSIVLTLLLNLLIRAC